jgi:hypothetical protein
MGTSTVKTLSGFAVVHLRVILYGFPLALKGFYLQLCALVWTEGGESNRLIMD